MIDEWEIMDGDPDRNGQGLPLVDDKNLLPVFLNEEKKKKGQSDTTVNFGAWKQTFCQMNGHKPSLVLDQYYRQQMKAMQEIEREDVLRFKQIIDSCFGPEESTDLQFQ